MNRLFTAFLFVILISGCNNVLRHKDQDKIKLAQLEEEWFNKEFNLDTVFLSSIIDSTFMCTTDKETLNKHETLMAISHNFSYRIKNNIEIDSFKLENVAINIYDHTAVVRFTDHTYATMQGKFIETQIPFLDVWIKRGDEWKAVASQGHY